MSDVLPLTRHDHLDRTPPEERRELLSSLGFGRVFTDHMVTMRYAADRGWYDFEIGPYAPLSLSPASLVFHYGQEIFEGLKAFRQPDGGVALFRPEANARRFRYSAERLAMAPVPEPAFLDAVRELVRVDRDWVPDADGATLYLRPFLVASQAVLGMKPSAEFLFCTVASPVGAYFKDAATAITLWATRDHSRAGPGGTGDAKCGGNYAASLAAQAEAVREGCDQVVFLDAVERRYVEELGGMNIFFVFDDGSLQTPPLGKTILAGITRDSLIVLARELGMTVREEPYALDDWSRDARRGRLTEAFACGTAAAIAPIGKVKSRDEEFIIGDGGIGPVTERLRSALVGIQRGTAADPHGWRDKIV